MSILSFTNSKPEQKILTFLKEVDASFQPKLSTKVDLVTYSKKLSKLANVFFATLDNKDIGIVAFYINSDRRTAFITVIGVLPDCQGKGIGKFLLDLVQDYAIEKTCLVLNSGWIRLTRRNTVLPEKWVRCGISDHFLLIRRNK